MRNKMLSLFVLLMIGLETVGYSQPQPMAAKNLPSAKIEWTTKYSEALALSKKTSKPIVLFFTGSDWCTWCNKLESEVLNTKEFVDAAADKYIFVKVDFPMNMPLDAETAKQNNALQDKFKIKGYPTIILIDSNEKEIGTTGYRQGGPQKYAMHLQKLNNDTIAER